LHPGPAPLFCPQHPPALCIVEPTNDLSPGSEEALRHTGTLQWLQTNCALWPIVSSARATRSLRGSRPVSIAQGKKPLRRSLRRGDLRSRFSAGVVSFRFCNADEEESDSRTRQKRISNLIGGLSIFPVSSCLKPSLLVFYGRGSGLQRYDGEPVRGKPVLHYLPGGVRNESHGRRCTGEKCWTCSGQTCRTNGHDVMTLCGQRGALLRRLGGLAGDW